MLPGVEVTLRNPSYPERPMHVNVFPKNGTFDFAQDEEFSFKTKEESLAFLKKAAQNNLLMLNHPYCCLLYTSGLDAWGWAVRVVEALSIYEGSIDP